MNWSPQLPLGEELMQALRSASASLVAPWAAPTPFAARAAGTGLSEVTGFGSNPGRLRMFLYTPATPPRRGAPLVVVLHGCDQDAAGFARDAGWIRLADRLGVPLLLPAQNPENNGYGCFNWFRESDRTRNRGEAMSIRQMVAEASARFRSDPRRIFVAGLSAGGAMTAALLAAYPDVFAGGAIIAGLPVGCANTAGQALARMQYAGDTPPQGWAACARRAAPPDYKGPWPRVSIWQGALDRTVDPANAEALVAQWTGLHGLDAVHPSTVATQGVLRHRVWGSPRHPAVESWTIDGMDHGFPVNTACQSDYILNVNLDAAGAIARFWGVESGAVEGLRASA